MQLTKSNTCIIFGSSPFIKEFGEDKIKYLQDNYTTFGINVFPIIHNNNTYWIWSDYDAYRMYKKSLKEGQKIIVSQEVYTREILPENIHTPEYIFEGVPDIQHEFNNKLAIYKTTAHCAINYAYLLGFKNVILCGVDLTTNWKHFYGGKEFKRTPVRINKIRNKLYEFKQYVNLYTLNNSSDLEIDRIDFSELV